MPVASQIAFTPCSPERDPARGLIRAMVAELAERYDIADGVLGVPLDPAEMAPPGGVYLVGRAVGAGAGPAGTGGEPVAGGGLRTIGAGLGEIKRMYVVPAWRGRGAGRQLLAALEESARRMGLARVRLDTGSAQPDARHLYESAGYRTIGNYNDNPHAAYWGEKDL